jgi:hypothetical protein
MSFTDLSSVSLGTGHRRGAVPARTLAEPNGSHAELPTRQRGVPPPSTMITCPVT